MAVHRVYEAPLPTVSLASEHPQIFGYLGVAGRIPHEHDFVRFLLFSKVTMYAHHQLHVLSDGGVLIPPDFDSGTPAEKAECAGDDERAPEDVPADAPEEKRPEIFHHLKAGHRVFRKSDRFDFAGANLAAVGHSNGAAGGDGFSRILVERQGHLEQGVG